MAAARSTRLRSRAEVTRARDRSRLRSAAIASARARAVTSAVVSRAMISTRVGRPLGWDRREKVMEKERGRPGSHHSRETSSIDTVWPVSATSSSWSRRPAGPASGNTSATGAPTISLSGRRALATSLTSSRTRLGARATATASGLRSTRAVTRSRSSRSSRRMVSSRPTSRKLTQAPAAAPSSSTGPPVQRTQRATPSWPTNWSWSSSTRSPARARAAGHCSIGTGSPSGSRTSNRSASSGKAPGSCSAPVSPMIRRASALA
jgi:hypothetical protein